MTKARNADPYAKLKLGYRANLACLIGRITNEERYAVAEGTEAIITARVENTVRDLIYRQVSGAVRDIT